MRVLTKTREKNIQSNTKSILLDYNLDLNWIYGIKIEKIKRPIIYVNLGSTTLQSNIVSSYSITENNFLKSNSISNNNYNIYNTSNTNDTYNYNNNCYNYGYDYDLYMYVSGKIVVLYYKTQNIQRYYLNHENEIISMCSSHNNEQLCCSAESSLRPSIHIWSIETLQTLKILQGYHQDGIHLLNFAYNSRFLLSVSQKDPSSIIVFDWKSEVIVSSNLMGFVAQDVSCIKTGTYTETFTNNFCNKKIEYSFSSSVMSVASSDEIYIFYFNKNGVYYTEIDLESSFNNIPKKINNEEENSNNENNSSDSISEIVSICLILVDANYSNFNIEVNNPDKKNQQDNYNNITDFNQNYLNNDNNNNFVSFKEKSSFIIVSGHVDGSLIAWNPKNNKLLKFLKKYYKPILSICCFSKGVVISQPDGSLFIWDLDLSSEIYELPFSQSISVVSTRVLSVVTNSSKSNLLLCLLSGEILEVILTQNNYEKNVSKIEKLNKLFLIDNINILTLTKELNPHIIYGGSNKTLYVINTEHNELVYINYLNDEITAIDSVILQNSELVIIVGCLNGSLYLIRNWNDFPNLIDNLFDSEISYLRFSYDDSLLFVCNEKSVYVLYLEENTKTFFISKRFTLEDTKPISLGLNDKYNYLIVITDNYKLFEINLKDFSIYDISNKYKDLQFNNDNNDDSQKHKDDLKTNKEIALINLSNTNWQSFVIRAPINPNTEGNLFNVSTFGNSSTIVVSSFEGNVFHFWKDYHSVGENTSQLLRVHNSHIQALQLTIDDKQLISGGFIDKMICKWSISQILNDEGAMKSQFNDTFKNSEEIVINDKFIISELKWSYFNKYVESAGSTLFKKNLSTLSDVAYLANYSQYKSIQDSNILIKGFNSKLLNIIYSEKYSSLKSRLLNHANKDILNSNDVNYNNNEDLYTNNIVEEFEKIRVGNMPKAFIELQYAHCSHIGERRDSVAYLHFSKSEDGKPINILNNTTNYEVDNIFDKDEHINVNKSNYFINQQREFLKKIINEDLENNKNLGQILQSFNFSKIREDNAHYNCEKYIIYFNSRIVVLMPLNNNTNIPDNKIIDMNFNSQNSYLPIKNNKHLKQKFYQGHKSRISCFAINTVDNLVATGEVCPFPCIHIWKPYGDISTYKIIETAHLGGIFILKFSSKAKYLLSIDINNAIEIYLNYTSIAYRHTSNYPILNAKFYNSSSSTSKNENKFITIGYRSIIIWKIKGNSIIKIKHVQSEEFKANVEYESIDLKIFTCLDFMEYILFNENSIETDILFGSNFGDISAISCDKYLVVKTRVHNGTVNCLKVTDLIEERKYIIITAGEDGIINIFDQLLNYLNTINPYNFSNLMLNNITSKQSKGIVSIDLYNCYQNKFSILVGFRCGDLIEIHTLDKMNIYDPKKNEDINIEKNNDNELEDIDKKSINIDNKSNKPYLLSEQIYSYPYIISDLSLSNSVNNNNNNAFNNCFAIHKFFPLMFLISKDSVLRLIDINTYKIIKAEFISISCSCIAMSPDCKILALGMIEGTVLLFDISMTIETTNKNSVHNTNYKLPSFKLLQNINDNNLGNKRKVIKINFSNEGDFIAISYDNIVTSDVTNSNNKNLNTELDKKVINNMAVLYMQRNSKLIAFEKIKLNINNLFIKVADIDIEESQFNANNLNKKECSITNMDFSNNSLFILLEITKTRNLFNNDNFNNYYNSNMFIMWDIKHESLTIDNDLINKVKFANISSPTAIYSKGLNSYFSFTKDLLNVINNYEDILNIDNKGISNFTTNQLNKNGNNDYNKNISLNQFAELNRLSSLVQIKNFINEHDLDKNKYNNSRSKNTLIVSGNESGLIHIFEKKALELDQSEIAHYDIENIPNNSMYLSRTFSGHTSSINCIDKTSDNSYIFTSCENEQCIFQFRFIEEDLFSDLDFFLLPMLRDPFNDVIGKLEFKVCIEEFWPIRESIRDVYSKININNQFVKNNNTSNKISNDDKDSNIDSISHENKDNNLDNNEHLSDPSNTCLELAYVLGRKSIDSRNNLKYDSNNRLVYHTSSYVLFLKFVYPYYDVNNNINSYNNNSKDIANYILKQDKLLPLESFDNSIQTEISYIAISNDKKDIALGHTGNIASISIWEINTETLICNVNIKEVSVINLIVFSDNKKKLVCTGIHKLYHCIIFVIDVESSSIQCSKLFINTLPFKIKSIAFLNNSSDNFVVCGIQNLSIWRIKGFNLEYSNIPIPIHNNEEHYFDSNGNIIENKNLISDENKDEKVNIQSQNLYNDFSNINDYNNKNNKFTLNSNTPNDNNKYGICLLESKENIYNYACKHDCLNPEEKIKISFLNVVVFENSIVVGTDSGHLFVFSFDKEFFSFKIKTHLSPILAMSADKKNYLLLSGSMDGISFLYGIILNNKFKISSIKKLMTFKVFLGQEISLKERIMNPDYNIQAVDIGINKVCIGTRSGNIIEYTISDDLKVIVDKQQANNINKELNLNHDNLKNEPLYNSVDNISSSKHIESNDYSNNKHTFIKFQDNDVPITLDFDIYSTRVFTITKNGNFRVLSLINFQVEFEYDFKNKALQSYHFRNINIVLLIFDYQILAIDTTKTNKNKIPQYKRINSFEIQIGRIIEVKVSPNEKILAVSLELNSNPCIYLYDILQGFVLKSVLDKFDSFISTIDFSIDSNYLIIEDNLYNTFYFEIQTKKHITLDDVNFEIEWMNDGLKKCDNFKCLPNVFGSDLGKVSKISKHPNSKIVAVGDYTGVLRLFTYPSFENDSYFTCRTDHVGKISHIVWSNDQKLLGTVSETDRTIYIYKIV